MSGAFPVLMPALVSSQRQAGQAGRQGWKVLGCCRPGWVVALPRGLWGRVGELGLGCEWGAWQATSFQQEGGWGVRLPGLPVSVSEVSRNEQRLALWGPLLGQRWEGQSSRGWGFSQSANVRKSSREAGGQAPAQPGGWVEGAGAASMHLSELCHWCSEQPRGACVVGVELMHSGPCRWAWQAPGLVLEVQLLAWLG